MWKNRSKLRINPKPTDKICECDQVDDQGLGRGEDHGSDQGDVKINPQLGQTPKDHPKTQGRVDTNHQVPHQARADNQFLVPQVGEQYEEEPVVSDKVRSSGRLHGKRGVGASRFDGRNYTS